MSARAKWAVVIVVVLLVSLVIAVLRPRAPRESPAISSPPLQAEVSGPALVKARAEELEATVVTPHLECGITDEKNILWCATFQLAWNELCELLGGPVQSSAAPEMARILNERQVTFADLDEDGCVALAGYPTGGADDIFQRIEAELDRKFRGAATPELLPGRASLSSNDWVAYAYLFKDLPFEWAFKRSQYAGMRFADRRFRCSVSGSCLSVKKMKSKRPVKCVCSIAGVKTISS